ncbi:unnamed protein product [Acanthoscelides obtectus]|uniref:Uncharacterized protein n=1 Tax=Acanthoscelides obtectus TaxID=200917 RepID=A0A9P0LEE6_ACAOB|nr:unnamed protein product [Acanthoscelides obtectus]CAK1681972.1 hypothetical protein AOBTE_LOCUS33357 [Acanthoscelides obtectus]
MHLMPLKRYNEDTAKYAYEVEALADKLKRAYIAGGVPANVAEKYTTQCKVSALKTNSSSEKVKIIMETATFNNCEEALTKFMSINSEDNTSNVLYTHQGGGFGNSRERGYHYFNSQGKRNNFQNDTNYRYSRGGQYRSQRGRGQRILKHRGRSNNTYLYIKRNRHSCQARQKQRGLAGGTRGKSSIPRRAGPVQKAKGHKSV